MKLLAYILLFSPLAACAQLSEHFDDGDFTQSPIWYGDTEAWQIRTGALQSHSQVPDSRFYLSTPSSLVLKTVWEFSVTLDFNTSSKNYVQVFLTSASAQLLSSDNTGYFVEIGGTKDEVSLFRQDPGHTVRIIDGQNETTSHTHNQLHIRVTCDQKHHWTLYRDISGTGSQEVPEGSCTDSVYTTSAWFGICVRQSTGSFFQKHFFDDIIIRPYAPDTIPPVVNDVYALSATKLSVSFSEAVAPLDAKNISNYSTGSHRPDSVIYLPDLPKLVVLLFSDPFPSDTPLLLQASGLHDLSGNSISDTSILFTYHPIQPFDIVINELMADPAPAGGLPEKEFVELRNNSRYPINLLNWSLSDDSHQAVFPDLTLQPDSLLILCAPADVEKFASFGNTLGLTHFPSLNNDGDIIVLRDETGAWIHAVNYSTEWYHEISEGGRSLEMKDPLHPCSEMNNWSVSVDASGGTPGNENSIFSNGSEKLIPDLVRIFVTDSLHVRLFFNQSLDSSLASDPSFYHIKENIRVDNATVNAPLLSSVILQLEKPLKRNTIYTMTVNGISGCGGMHVGVKNSMQFGIAEPPSKNDILLSEILFHPQEGGKDFIEIYNHSQKITDAGKLILASRDEDGNLVQKYTLSPSGLALLPGTFLVITSDPADIKARYYCKNPDAFLRLKDMPSFNNDAGDVVLVNETGTLLDEYVYSENDHFPLIRNPAGISLEKADYNKSSQDRDNWESAAADVGYATPTYQNSHAVGTDTSLFFFKINPAVISPDHDSRDDQANIPYRLPTGEWVANAMIFDAHGKPVRRLYDSYLLSHQGILHWDGLNDHHETVRTGLYILFIEVFNKEGQVHKWKLPITVVRRE